MKWRMTRLRRSDPTLDLANATALVPRATPVMAPPAGFGQDGEDVHAYRTYFAGMTDGTFLEMGALDGAACRLAL